MPFKLFAFLLLTGLLAMAKTGRAQSDSADSNGLHSLNMLDLQLFGNKGFFAIGYSRKLVERGKFSLLAGPAVGLVPGSHDSASPNPAYYELNFGSAINFSFGLNELCAGASYSRILYAGNGFNRVIGEFAFIRHFRKINLSVKIAYTPIWYENGSDDVQYVPVSIAWRVML
jgi:hypothetical protein